MMQALVPQASAADTEDDAAFYRSVLRHAQLSQAIGVAAELGLAERLAHGAVDADRLARDAGCDRSSLVRLFAALTAAGLTESQSDGAWALTRRGRLLVSTSRESVRGSFRWWARYRWPVWRHLADSIATGQDGRREALGYDGFDLLRNDPHAAAIFNAAMSELSRDLASEVAHSIDLHGVTTIVDVGGGDGTLLGALLAAHSHLRGVLLELAHAMPAASRQLASAGVLARCELVSGNFLHDIPGGGTLYVLQRVLHDWDDDRCIAICAACRGAMPPQARLLIVERVLPPSIEASDAHLDVALSDLNMLVMLGGRERSEPAFRRILVEAGLEWIAARQLVHSFQAITARPRLR